MTLWLTHGARGPLTHCFTRAPGAPVHTAPHAQVIDEEYRNLNYRMGVPGLLEEAVSRYDAGESETGSLISGDLKDLGVNYTLAIRKYSTRHIYTLMNGKRRLSDA